MRILRRAAFSVRKTQKHEAFRGLIFITVYGRMLSNKPRKKESPVKRTISLLCALIMVFALLASCTGKTPDVIESEAAMMSLDDVNWSIPIVIEATGETVTYTMEQAKTHALAKTYISAYQAVGDNEAGNNAPQVATFIFEGVLFKDVLADIGVTECSSVTVTHNAISTPFEYDKDIVWSDNTVVGWIQNKTMIVEDSAPSYVAFGSKDGGVHDFCHSIKEIIIHP